MMLDRFAIRDDKHADALFRWLVWVVVLLAFWLRTMHLVDVPSRSPDEGVYSGSALRLAHEGPAAYRQIFSEYAADPSRWIYPAPTRVVPVSLFAGVMTVTGSSSAQAGAAVSWALGIASVWLLAWLGRRFFGRTVGLIAALFLATYVPELEFARRAWGETTASFFTLALVYAGCLLDAEPRRWRHWVAFFATGTVCLLVKETSIFAYGLCGVWLAVRRVVVARDYRSAALLTGGGLASLLAALGVLVVLAGSVDRATFGLMQVFGNGLGSNDWGAQYASGPWYQFGHLLGALAPLTALMALLGVLVVTIPHAARGLLEPEVRGPASLAVLLTLGFVAACAFGPNLQYLRIMAPANPSYCLLSALGVSALGVASERWLRPMAQPGAAAIAVLLFVAVAFRDHAVYSDVVVRTGMQDLAVRWLLDGIARRAERPTLPSTIPSATPPTPPTVGDMANVPNPPARPGGSPSDPRRTVLTPEPSAAGETAALLIARSLEHCRREQWSECVATARAAWRLEPLRAEAWNNAAVGYAGLQLWDDAERCAQRALELQPDFQLARNNLAWVREEKAKRTASLASP